MSSGTLPKTKLSRSSMGQLRENRNVENSCSQLFELTPKPKLFCIPENNNRIFNKLRKTQSLNVHPKVEHGEKSWSVIFMGSKLHDMYDEQDIL